MRRSKFSGNLVAAHAPGCAPAWLWSSSLSLLPLPRRQSRKARSRGYWCRRLGSVRRRRARLRQPRPCLRGRGVTHSTHPAGESGGCALEVRMTQLEQDLRGVTGRLEEVSFQIRKLEDRLNKLTSDMEYRLSEMKSGGGSEASPEPSPGGGAGGGRGGRRRRSCTACSGSDTAVRRGFDATGAAIPSTGASAPTQTANLPPKTAREQYARAFSLLEKRNYEEAGAGFSEFLKANPNDPLADNARYWLGETYYARGDYARSAEVFLDGYEKNKTGPKAPDTLF